jgi:hypothetical protein
MLSPRTPPTKTIVMTPQLPDMVHLVTNEDGRWVIEDDVVVKNIEVICDDAGNPEQFKVNLPFRVENKETLYKTKDDKYVTATRGDRIVLTPSDKSKQIHSPFIAKELNKNILYDYPIEAAAHAVVVYRLKHLKGELQDTLKETLEEARLNQSALEEENERLKSELYEIRQLMAEMAENPVCHSLLQAASETLEVDALGNAIMGDAALQDRLSRLETAIELLTQILQKIDGKIHIQTRVMQRGEEVPADPTDKMIVDPDIADSTLRI